MKKINFKKLKPNRKTVTILILAVCAAFVVMRVVHTVKRANTYKSAVTAIEKGSYETARKTLHALGDYKDAKLLSTYSLARIVYDGGQATSDAALNEIRCCLESIPDSYSGELASDITTFKTQFGGYRQRREDYKAETAFLHPEAGGSSGRTGSNVQHTGNFYKSFAQFYECAKHFWDEDDAA